MINTKDKVIYELDEIVNGLTKLKARVEADQIPSREYINYYFEHLHSLLSFFPPADHD